MKRGLLFGLIGAIVLGVVVVLIIALTGSSSTTPADNTLTIWSPFDEEETYRQVSEQYLADNPSVKLAFKYVEATDAKDYEAKVVDALANGNGPDIWLIRTDWLAKHQAKLIPSTDYVSWSKNTKDAQAAAEEYFGTNIAAQNSRDKQLFGFPLAVDSLALYINTKVVSETQSRLSEDNSAEAEKLSSTPVTWSDVITWSRLLTNKDSRGTITTSGLALGTTANTYAAVDVFNTILSQYGGSLFTDDEKGVGIHLIKVINGQNFTPGAAALTLYSSFGRSGDTNYSWNTAQGDPVKAFVDHKLAMMIGYSSLIKDILKASPEITGVSIVPLPQVDDPQTSGKRVDGANYWTHVVSKFSNKPGLAWLYLQALGRNGGQRYGQLTGKPSLNQAEGATTKLGSGGFDETDLFAQQATFASTNYKTDWQTVDEIVQDMLNQVVLPNQSIQSGLDSAAERLKAVLR